MSARTLFVCSILSSTVLAQGRILIVDQNGGGQFTDLPAAIAAANPGDVLRVRAGNYSSFVLTKGISILGSQSGSGGTHLMPSASTVTGVPATETVVLADLNFSRALRIENCAGPILVERMLVATGLRV